MKKNVGINGFGRFGLHLLKYWLDRDTTAQFEIAYINDDTLSIEDAFGIITSDTAVIFNKYKKSIKGNTLTFLKPDGALHTIEFSHSPKEHIPWLGKPDLIFECSGKNTSKLDCKDYLVGQTSLVIISATSWDAPICVYGFNHTKFQAGCKVISYGSCTVNAYIPLAQFLHEHFMIKDSDVDIIHNVQTYRLKESNTLLRKFCTLQKVAVQQLNFLSENNFHVNYTVVPYTGVSMLDFRFRFTKAVTRESFVNELETAIAEGVLKGLYGLDEVDIGPEVHNCSTYSAVFIKEGIRILGDTVHLFGYFDNENSVNRYFDLANYICMRPGTL